MTSVHSVEAVLDEAWASVTAGRAEAGSGRLDLLPPLAVVRLLVEVETRLDLRIPFECFFRPGLTVRELAGALDGSRPTRGAGASQLAVPVQPGGSRPPLFFVHGDEYAMLSLRRFTPALGADQPLIGLLPERVHRRFDRALGLTGLVPGLLRAMRDLQARGPYHLAGHSLGGIVAYEMAGRLVAEGERVGWLALADTQTPAALRGFYADLMAPGNRLRRQLRRGPAALVRKSWEVAGRRLPRRAGPPAANRGLPAVDFDHEGARAIYEASEVRGHELPLDLFFTGDGVRMSRSAYLGWDAVHRGPLVRHEVSGDHMTMLSEPNVDVLARRMAGRLREVLGAG